MIMWKGPLVDGITQSLIIKFLECPYRFYIYAILGLKEYEELHPNLIYGDTGHVGLENIIDKPITNDMFSPEDWDDIKVAMQHHMKDYYPTGDPFYVDSLMHYLPLYDDTYKERGTFTAELPFRIPYRTHGGNDVTLRGKIDGHCPDLGTIVEHKFKGKIDPVQARYEIPVDLQVNVYLYASKSTKVIYDLLRIPDNQWSMPPKRSMEKKRGYIKSLYVDRKWGDFPVYQKKHLWIAQEEFTIQQEDIEKYMSFTVSPICDLICAWYEHVTDPKFDIEDPACYGALMYQSPVRLFNPSLTLNFKCNYHSYLTNQIEREDLIPVEDYFPEIQEDDKTKNLPNFSPKA